MKAIRFKFSTNYSLKNMYGTQKYHSEDYHTVISTDKLQYKFEDSFMGGGRDLTDGIFDNNCNDLITCNHILEHLESEKDAV